jgi:hypothetical protein
MSGDAVDGWWTRVSFKYDPAGRPIYKSFTSGASIYAYNDDGNLVEETNASGTAVARRKKRKAIIMRSRLFTQRRLTRTVAIVAALPIIVLGAGCRSRLRVPDQTVYLDTARMQLSPTTSPPQARIALSKVEYFRLLPDSIKQRVGPQMAEPGRAFNPGDVSIPGVPNRRLIFAEVYKPYYLVHYETGGEAHGFVVAFFKVSESKAIPLWAYAGTEFADAADFAKQIETRPLKNEVDAIFGAGAGGTDDKR